MQELGLHYGFLIFSRAVSNLGFRSVVIFRWISEPNPAIVANFFFFSFFSLVSILIRIRIHRIHMFLGLLDPDPGPLVRVMDPDPYIIKQKQ
jgi:hypothetical protein